MTVRRNLSALAALLVLLFCAGCGEREGAALPAETDEPFYVQGVQLKKLGRNGEALTAFLKVIDRRGERGAAESHFEAGEIFLNHAKDPGEAYHHFRKYLELQPNSKQAELVRGRVDIAKREFWKQVAGRPLDDNSVRLQIDEEMSKLKRENDELRAELSVLRGGGAIRPPRLLDTGGGPARPAPITVPTASVADSPIKPAPSTTMRPTASSSFVTPAPTQASGARPPATGQSQPPRSTLPATSGRTYTVKPKETLYGIARQFNVKLEDLMALNGIKKADVVSTGTVLKIPASASATRR